MRQDFALSTEEQEAIEALGGIDRAADLADQVLARRGLHRGLFTRTEREQIRRAHGPKTIAIEFEFDPSKSLRANIERLLTQAEEIQISGSRTHYVGAMLHHLVGAKLDLVLGGGKIHHRRFSVADESTARSGDYHMENVAIHVTTHPGEALIRKCGENLQAGLKPLIITLGEAVRPAEFTIKAFELTDRVDVLDAAQFLTANVYERSLFKAADCRATLTAILTRYNEIVDACETDPSPHIKL